MLTPKNWLSPSKTFHDLGLKVRKVIRMEVISNDHDLYLWTLSNNNDMGELIAYRFCLRCIPYFNKSSRNLLLMFEICTHLRLGVGYFKRDGFNGHRDLGEKAWGSEGAYAAIFATNANLPEAAELLVEAILNSNKIGNDQYREVHRNKLRSSVYSAIESDINYYSGVGSDLGNDRKIWPKGNPLGFDLVLYDLIKYMDASPSEWSAWKRWYNLRTNSSETEWGLSVQNDASIDDAFLDLDPDWWNNTPEFINKEIEQWINDINNNSEYLLDGDNFTDPEPQNEFGLVFSRDATGKFDVNYQHGSDELLVTPDACDRHGELRELIFEAIEFCIGHNQAGSLVPYLERVADTMGGGPRELRVAQFMQRTERCLKLANALAEDLAEGKPLSKQPGRTRDIIAVLEALPSAYWMMVNLDPALARRIPMMRDQDFHELPNISIRDINIFLKSSVSMGILSDIAMETIQEGAEVDFRDSSDIRNNRRFWETVKNFPRAVLGFLVGNSKKITIGAIAAGTMAAAKWLGSGLIDQSQ